MELVNTDTETSRNHEEIILNEGKKRTTTH